MTRPDEAQRESPGKQPRSALRTGRTTGSCAALAARAAARMLLTGEEETTSSLETPSGERLAAALHAVLLTPEAARCAVVKDAGDDPDVTNGLSVFAEVRRRDGTGVVIDGGEGIGRVTKAGLDQPVGAAAINSVPRRMIAAEVRAVCAELGHDVDAGGGGLAVTVSIPGGEAIAARTFNPRLGVEGGLSILGTTGIVEPMSTRAVVETIRLELRVLRETGATGAILTPGRYGENFLRGGAAVPPRTLVICSNFIGEALDAAKELGFSEILVVGHLGKLVKLSGGVMDTHSRVADCRLELLALHAALCGADAALLARLLESPTVDAALAVLDGADAALRRAAVAALLARAERYCALRTGDAVQTGLAAFTNSLGLLGMSPRAEEILARWNGGEEERQQETQKKAGKGTGA